MIRPTINATSSISSRIIHMVSKPRREGRAAGVEEKKRVSSRRVQFQEFFAEVHDTTWRVSLANQCNG